MSIVWVKEHKKIFLFLVAMFFSVSIPIYTWLPGKYEVIITDANSKIINRKGLVERAFCFLKGKGKEKTIKDTYMIYTGDGVAFTNISTIPFNIDSSILQGRALKYKGKKVNIWAYGWSCKIFKIYENVLTITED